MSMPIIILILFYIFSPMLILYLGKVFPFIQKIGAVLISYLFGIILGNIGILPEGSKEVQEMITQITIPIALPMLLFSLDVKQWFKLAGKTMLSLLIGVFSVVTMILIGYYIFRDDIDNIWQISGMLVGIYTGGTPNLAAIKTALGVSQEVYILTHTYEMFLGAFYLLFVLSIGQKVFLKFLPGFKKTTKKSISSITNVENEDDFESYNGIFKRKIFMQVLLSFGISVVILGISFLLSKLIPDDYATAFIILALTTFGIALSLVPRIKTLKKSFQGGMYLILIFCVTVASMADLKALADISFDLLYFVGIAMFGSLILQAILSKIFKIDADTVIIASTALICSPPFVPVVAGSLKNKEIILSGITIGIIGYAIGNYVGVILAYMLR